MSLVAVLIIIFGIALGMWSDNYVKQSSKIIHAKNARPSNSTDFIVGTSYQERQAKVNRTANRYRILGAVFILFGICILALS